MKKILIGTVVGAIIVFVWQALSWMAFGIHKDAFKYSDKEQQVLSTLSQNLNEGGLYMMPGAPSNATMEQRQEVMKNMEGKAWASVNYIPSYHFSAGRAYFTMFLMTLICAWIVAWSLVRTKNNLPSFGWIWVASMGFPLFAYLFIDVSSMIFGNMPAHFMSGQIWDLFISWGLAGVWFAWYLGRGEQTSMNMQHEPEKVKASMYE